mgnify:CR=1 FL=1
MLDFLDVLVRRDTLTIGDNGPLGGACEVGDDEAYHWIKFARTPFNFSDYPAFAFAVIYERVCSYVFQAKGIIEFMIGKQY